MVYSCTIENEVREFYSIDEVVDFIEDKVCFEVDPKALRVDLKLLNVFEWLTLREDCIIQRKPNASTI